MPLKAGDKLGPYEIISLIGKGGMGEVYSAHDPRTGRDVAIKVSAERFHERFDREVRAVAALNHPNICTLYDVGPNYLVMELVEGPTLAERINEGSISEDEALILAGRIADALQAAHEKGIVHRDLKPGNVKITPSGNVKVLDFGLAKMGGIPAAPSEHSPTLTMNETQAGVILGTAGYMSPEQAKGKPVDKRADIFSFGVVLHEMLSGQRVFQGETLSETLASVLKEEPDFNRVPAKPRRLLKACLQKDPTRRLQDIGDAMLLLEESESAAPSASRLGTLAWVIAGVSVLGAAGLAFLHFREKAPANELVRFGIPYPEKMTPTTAGAFSVSPDGRKLVFLGAGADGMVRVWLRQLDSTEAHPVPGTETVNVPPPFWSPDSRSFAFVSADQKLKRVDTAGGPPQTICDLASAPWGGGWNRDGVIIFGSTRGVMKVSASGGQPSAVTLDNSSRGEAAHRFPSFLPDGKHFLYLTSVTMAAETGGLYAGTIDAQPEQQSAKRILATGYSVVYVPSDDPNKGRVLFLRDGSLMAQVFDAGKLELAGEAVPVADQVSSAPNGYYGRFSASENGVLIYRTGTSSGTQLNWFSRQGAIVGKVGEPGAYGTISSSPDGTKAAATVNDPKTGSTDIWVIDPVRGTNSRLTFDPASSTQPEWSPDGNHIAYISNRGGEWGIYQKAVNGSGSEELLAKTGKTTPTLTHWTQDGRFLIYFSAGEKTGGDLWVLPLTGDRKPFPFLRMPFDQIGGRVSPDGRWIAYRSNESGKNELYVQAFTPTPEAGNLATGGKWMVSKGSEGMARWRKDGKELYYITADGSIMAVDATTASGFSAGLPRLLFKLPAGFFQMATATPGARVDTPDGQRFLVSMPAAENAGPEFSVVLNWQAALKK